MMMKTKTKTLMVLATAAMLSVGCVSSDPEQSVSDEIVSDSSVGTDEAIADFGEAGDYTLEDVNTPAPDTAEVPEASTDVVDNEAVNFGSAYDTDSPVVNVADESIASGAMSSEASPIAEAEMSSVAGQYSVIKGDTLSQISQRELGSAYRWPAVARRNHLKNPHLIFPGQKINVSSKH